MNGTVYWITGLSGAGKTTVGELLYEKIHMKKDNVVLLDGDELRKIFRCYDYSDEGRKKLAFKYSELCFFLSNQGIDVIICTISMYDDVRKWNRENIRKYKEIYLKVPIEVLIKRNQKGLYIMESKENVVGLNSIFEEPKNPDIILVNDGTNSPKYIIKKILDNNT